MFKGKSFYTSKTPIKTLGQYFDHLEYSKSKIFKEGKLWYRGHANNTYKLKPSIYRVPYSVEREYEKQNQFKDKTRGFINTNGLEPFDWLFLMQHYGLKTRLLDWTEGSLIALFFALKLGPGEFKSQDPCVWLIDPIELNFLSQGEKMIFRTEGFKSGNSSPLLFAYKNLEEIPSTKVSYDYPIAISSAYSNERILRQKGRFTIHDRLDDDILSIFRRKKSNRIARIDIDAKSRDSIKKELNDTGVSESVLFPDLEALAREINYYWND